MARRRATDAERALWSAAMRDVHRLRPDEPLAPPPIEPAPVAAEPSLPPPDRNDQPPVPPGPVDRPTVERLRRGRVSIDARVDLHGLDQKEAFTVLLSFLDLSVHAGRRTVLVITGKGAISQGGGVLRRNAPNWLLASPLASRILTIQPAHRIHGGDGAFYVLLRRKR